MNATIWHTYTHIVNACPDIITSSHCIWIQATTKKTSSESSEEVDVDETSSQTDGACILDDVDVEDDGYVGYLYSSYIALLHHAAECLVYRTCLFVS